MSRFEDTTGFPDSVVKIRERMFEAQEKRANEIEEQQMRLEQERHIENSEQRRDW